MAHRGTAALVIVAAVLLTGVLLAPVRLVRVADGDGRTLACARTGRDATITLAFTHSMYGGDVREMYRPGAGDTLRRTGIVTDNAAAAEYYAWDGQVRERDGRYEVIVPEATFATLPFRIDHIGNHRLEVDGQAWNLAAMVEEPTQAWLSVVTRPLLTQVFGTRC